MDIVIWAVVIGFLFGTVNGTVQLNGLAGFALGSLLILTAMAFSVMVLVK